MSSPHHLVRLANGTCSVHSEIYGETCHPVVGPAAEAETLYVRQWGLVERVRSHVGEFVIWDVGLGAGANALTVLRALRAVTAPVRMVSFDESLDPLRFAASEAEALGYFAAYTPQVDALLEHALVNFTNGTSAVTWQAEVGDFPTRIGQREAATWPKPHAILFDPYSPKVNPAMWTAPLFTQLYRLLDPARPCVLATYSRSTLLRVTLLLAGFFVGSGESSGAKEETTVAANTLDLIARPLGANFLRRAHLSDSAEPLREATYRRACLEPETWKTLQQHPQFAEVKSASK